MPMNADLLAQEMLAAIGGKVTKQRAQAFRKLASAIVRHIQVNAVVTVTAAPNGPITPGTVT